MEASDPLSKPKVVMMSSSKTGETIFQAEVRNLLLLATTVLNGRTVHAETGPEAQVHQSPSVNELIHRHGEAVLRWESRQYAASLSV